MITFEKNNASFSCRAVSVAICENHLLIHQVEGDDFWALPGGRMEFFEHSKDAVVREMKEELGLDCEVIRPLWYVESFFDLYGKNRHEIATYYLVSFGCDYKLPSKLDFNGIEKEPNLIFRWVKISDLGRYNLQPEFVSGKLQPLGDSVEFICNDDRN